MKILGMSDSVTTCDCCGEKDLNRTVVLETSNGDVVFYGSSCATNKYGVRTSLLALQTIERAKKDSTNIREFAAIMRRKGFGNMNLLGPLWPTTHSRYADVVTWKWEQVEITARVWNH